MHKSTANLLIVDDNKVNRLLMSRSVDLLGYRSSLAENGREALDLLHEQEFDLMLLDIEMPVMDGFQVLEAIKQDPDLRDLPVLVTSSMEGIENIVRCIELGADDYLSKPVNPVLLKARLSSSLEKKRLRDEQKVLLQRFATSEVAQDLQDSGFTLGGSYVEASVLFCDIRGFTSLSESQPPDETIELLNIYYTLMFEAIESNGGVVNQMIGDGLMVLFGAPKPLDNFAGKALTAAREMLMILDQFNAERAAADKPPIEVGIGIATGNVIAGYTGTTDRATYTCVGDKVNFAARLEAHTKAAACSILIDDTTKASAGAGSDAISIGSVEFKGFPEPVEIFSVSI